MQEDTSVWGTHLLEIAAIGTAVKQVGAEPGSSLQVTLGLDDRAPAADPEV